MKHRPYRSQHEHADSGPDLAPSVGRATLTQRFASRAPAGERADDVAAAAGHGIAGAGGAVPYLDAIQRSFGDHDLGGVVAHVGGEAAEACDAMGAHGYATGNHVAFAESPSLFLVAHEVAHVVQQRAGVHLSGGVGAEGDVYEQQADAVAARVVRGESAADLLPAPGGAARGAVQRKADSRHDHRERVGGDDAPHDRTEIHDLHARITAVQAAGGQTEITIGCGYLQHVWIGYEGYVADGHGGMACEFTIHDVSEKRAKAFVPFAVDHMYAFDHVVVRPSHKPAKAQLEKPTQARITQYQVSGDLIEVTFGIGQKQGVGPGTRGYFENGGRRHAFVVERTHFHPSRTTVAVPAAGTEAARDGQGLTVDWLLGATVTVLP